MKQPLLMLMMVGLFLIGCGGGTGSGTEDGTGTGNPGTGASGVIPKNFVEYFSCEETVIMGEKRVTIKGGSNGSISVSCDGENEIYSLTGASLDVTDARIIRTTVEKSSSGKAISIIDIDLKKRDNIGEVKYYLSNTETNEIVSCKATFRSPLPLTVSTDEAISKLIDPLQNIPLMLTSDCPATLPSSKLSSKMNHELSISENAELFIDDSSIPDKTTWVYNLN